MSRSKCAYSPNSKLRLYTDRTLPPCFQTFLYGLYEKGAWSQVNRVPTSKYELLRMFLKADPRDTVVDQIFFFGLGGSISLDCHFSMKWFLKHMTAIKRKHAFFFLPFFTRYISSPLKKRTSSVCFRKTKGSMSYTFARKRENKRVSNQRRWCEKYCHVSYFNAKRMEKRKHHSKNWKLFWLKIIVSC